MEQVAEKQNTSTLTHMGDVFQKKVIGEILKPNNINLKTNSDFFTEVISLLKISYFDDAHYKQIVKMIINYNDSYKKQPNLDNIHQMIQIEIKDDFEKEKLNQILIDINTIWKQYKSGEINNDSQSIKDNFLRFIRNQEFKKLMTTKEKMLLDGQISDSDLLDFREELSKITDIGKDKDFGVEISEGIDDLLRDDFRDPIGTGIKEIDEVIDGSIGKGELCLFLAAQGVGKSSILTYTANYGFLTGNNVLHVILEGNEKEIRRKHIAKMVGISAKKLKDNKDMVKKRIQEIDESTSTGVLTVKRFNEGTTVNTLKNWILATQEKKGIKYNLIVIDYIDELSPNKMTMNKYENEESVVRSIESLAGELNVPIYSAVQAKKEANNKRILDANDCGGSIAKLKKAHLVIGLGADAQQLTDNMVNFNIIKCRFARTGRVWEDCKFDRDILTIETNPLSTTVDSLMNNNIQQASASQPTTNDLLIQNTSF